MMRYRRRGERWPVPVGTITYIDDRRDPYAPAPRHPWQVVGWMPREYMAARVGPDGRWRSTYMAGGHLAIVRDLRTGRVAQVADWLILASIERHGER